MEYRQPILMKFKDLNSFIIENWQSQAVLNVIAFSGQAQSQYHTMMLEDDCKIFWYLQI
jgi:hypothetical protein